MASKKESRTGLHENRQPEIQILVFPVGQQEEPIRTMRCNGCIRTEQGLSVSAFTKRRVVKLLNRLFHVLKLPEFFQRAV